jgi:hypothetical protein
VVSSIQQPPALVVVEVSPLATRDTAGIGAWKALLKRPEVGEEVAYVAASKMPFGFLSARGLAS